MICPKCGKKLKRVELRAGTYYGHSYTLAHVMADKPICDYSTHIEVKAK